MAKPVREIPSTVTHVDPETGADIRHERMSWKVQPPPLDHCQICAVKHDPRDPHNAQSLYYQVTFNGIVGRAPTWADAVAHCSDAVKEVWERELRIGGHWTAPPQGEAPVQHHGVG